MLPSYLESNFNCSGDLLIKRVRQLAKTSYWQTIYGATKELNFKIFNNQTDFSDLQILMLNYMGFYNALNMDIALGEVPDMVLEDELYEEAYMYYKQKVDKKKLAERPKQQQQQSTPSQRETVPPQVNWVFKKPKKA